MLDLIQRVNGFTSADVPALNKALADIESQALGVIYTSTEPTISTTPLGKIVIYDNGAGTKRIYVRTGQNNLGYVALT